MLAELLLATVFERPQRQRVTQDGQQRSVFC
jgi:hypothetical protein